MLAQHHIPFDIVPGITSGIAAPAYAGIPVTHRDLSSSFAMVTGHMREGKDDSIRWESLAKALIRLPFIWGLVIYRTSVSNCSNMVVMKKRL